MNINVKLKIVITLTRDLLLIHFLLPKLISLFFFNNVPSPLGFVDLELPYNVLYDGSEKGKKKEVSLQLSDIEGPDALPMAMQRICF